MGLLQQIFLFLAILLQLHLSGAEFRRGCCHPDKMMGKVLRVEDQREFRFALDYSKNKFMVIEDEDNFSLLDAANGKLTINTGGVCRVQKTISALPFTKCKTHDMFTGKTPNLGLPQSIAQSIPTNLKDFGYTNGVGRVWEWVFDDADWVEADDGRWLPGSADSSMDKVCIPTVIRTEENGVNVTLVFSSVKHLALGTVKPLLQKCPKSAE